MSIVLDDAFAIWHQDNGTYKEFMEGTLPPDFRQPHPESIQDIIDSTRKHVSDRMLRNYHKEDAS